MKKKAIIERTAKIIFLVCAVVAVFAVLAITVYMVWKGTPALAKVGVFDLVRLAAHVSNGCKSRIRPAVGRI